MANEIGLNFQLEMPKFYLRTQQKMLYPSRYQQSDSKNGNKITT